MSVNPVPVDDSVPRKDKIEGTVKHLQRNRSGGASGMRKREAAEKGEGEGTTEGEEGESTEPNWESLVDLVHTAFREGRLV